MSSIAKKFFIASLVYLILALLAQVINVFDVWLGFNPFSYTATAATQQLFLIGWLTQLGLALIYDRWFEIAALTTAAPVIVFVLLNLGLPLVILGQPGLILFGGYWLGAVAAFGSLLQLLAGLVFVVDLRRVFQNGS